jgi:hypothetical protein
VALADGDRLPIRYEIKLIFFLQWDPDYDRGLVRGADWERQRLLRAKRWLGAWKRLRTEQAKIPDLNGSKELNVFDIGRGIMDEDDSNEIEDPILRKQKEAAIARRTEQHRLSRLKEDLKRLDESLAPRAKRYLVQAYGKPPYANKELEALLEDSVIAPADRAALVEEVNKNIAERTERDGKLPKQAVVVVQNNKAAAESEPSAADDDPRLLQPLTFDLEQPKVDDLLAKLREATGVQFTRAEEISNDEPVRGSVSYSGVPATIVMQQLADAEQVAGEWKKEGDGYRLLRSGKAVVTPMPKAAQVTLVAPDRMSLARQRLLQAGPPVALAVIAAFLLLFRSRRKVVA